MLCSAAPGSTSGAVLYCDNAAALTALSVAPVLNAYSSTLQAMIAKVPAACARPKAATKSAEVVTVSP